MTNLFTIQTLQTLSLIQIELKFVSLFASQSNGIKLGDCFLDVCCIN